LSSTQVRLMNLIGQRNHQFFNINNVEHPLFRDVFNVFSCRVIQNVLYSVNTKTPHVDI